MPRKFDQDAKHRVVRLMEERILAENISMQAACKIVAPKLGVSWHTARQWTQAGSSPGKWCIWLSSMWLVSGAGARGRLGGGVELAIGCDLLVIGD